MTRIGTLFILVFICVYSNSQALQKKYYLKNYNINSGLSDNTVNAILQDSHGFMWFGTKDGLSRYDGHAFKNYKKSFSNSKSLGNNFVTKLYECIDGKIWIGTDAGMYLYSPDTDVFEPFDLVCNDGEIINKAVTAIIEDGENNIWIAVHEHGIFCYDRKLKRLDHYPLHDYNNIKTNVESIAFDSRGVLWVGFYGDGLFFSNDKLKTLSPYINPTDLSEPFEDDIVNKILGGKYNTLYVSSAKCGVQEINLTSGKIKGLMITDDSGNHVYCRDLMFTPDNKLWIASESGVYIYNKRTKNYSHLQHSSSDKYSLSDNAIYSLCQDSEGGVWIGTYFGGVNHYPQVDSYFEKYYISDANNGLQGKRVREFCEDADGLIWVGTEDGGLSSFNPSLGEFRLLEVSNQFSNVHGLCVDGDYLWVGTFAKGLKKIDIKGRKVVKEYMKGNYEYSFDNSVFSICKTIEDTIFIGTSYGLHIYDRAKDDFVPIKELDGCFVYDIKEDNSGNIWIATYAHGAFRYNVNSHKWEHFVFDKDDSSTLPYNKVLSIFEDSYNQIWLTTQGGGFCRFDEQTSTFIRYNPSNTLGSDVVYQIKEDNSGIFWLTTNVGLVRFNPDNDEFKLYTAADGLLSGQFNYRSSLKDSNGNIYFGTTDGFIKFNPSTFTKNDHLPPIVITDLLLSGEGTSVNDSGSPLNKSILFLDKITLKHSQNSFSLRLAALGYCRSELRNIQYKLEGFDKQWSAMSNNPYAIYANMPYGDYKFRANIVTNEGVWGDNELVLNISILPPFYLTIYAYLLYIALIVTTIIYLFFYLKNKNIARQKLEIGEFKQEKERELHRAKIDFFTHVAHEIRTPLTLIKGPLDSIMSGMSLDSVISDELNIMQKNTDRLLYLTNQLLDFRKIEEIGYRLNFTDCDVIAILNETYVRFSSLAKRKNIHLTLNTYGCNECIAHVNRDAFTKIISNLINNAVKFSDTYVIIDFSKDDNVDNPSFIIKFTNDGVTIPLEMREDIFKAFVSINSADKDNVSAGTGIGLALSRSLVELHQGSLVLLKSKDINCFSLTLPMHQQGVVILKEMEALYGEESQPNGSEAILSSCGDEKDRKNVLVVEDNIELLQFIKDQFVKKFTVYTAKNGVEAIDILDKHDIQLVVTDVIMPAIGGLELCKHIKSNLASSHIPVILLTAKTSIQSKMDGLEVGADIYIEKPFSIEYLLANAFNLITNREKLKLAFVKQPFLDTQAVVLSKADREFMKMLNEIVQDNLTNSDFSMEGIAESFCMSRSNFYRKMKGVLSLNPNEYLRIERLKRAAQLIKEGDNRISEICYMVGFNSPSYFAKCFQKQFGLLPKDFANKLME